MTKLRLPVRSLTFKLTLAFLVVSLTGIALVAAMVWGITAQQFNQFLIDRGLNTYTQTVTNYYKTNSTWNGVDTVLSQQGFQVTTNTHNSGTRGGPPPAPFILVNANNQVLVPAGFYHTGDQIQGDHIQQEVAINVNGQVVGYVVVTGGPARPDPFESRYLANTNQALILAAVGAIIIAVFLGLVLARTITRPVRELTEAASSLALGKSNQPVQVRSKDELGELTSTFNKMSSDLVRSNQLRRQMTADIAHDLRTPLAVITGYLEGLKDGVVKPTPKRFEAMYDEALYLQRLVEDLRTLSLADAGELSMTIQSVLPGELVDRLAETYQHQAEQREITFKTSVEPGLPAIEADPERILQALNNLVSNALHYTPKGGVIELAACKRCDEKGCTLVQFEVKDSGVGIEPDVLPHVFERFYRGDSSRQEEGSGLGLAIAKSIVDLHKGFIYAQSEGAGKGSLFRIELPQSAI